MTNDPRPELSTVELMKETVEEARQLLKTEVALAKDELDQQIDAAKRVAIVMGVSMSAALLGLAMLLVAMVLRIAPRPLTALITGLVLLLIAGIAALFGYLARPKQPLPMTRERLAADAKLLKERFV